MPERRVAHFLTVCCLFLCFHRYVAGRCTDWGQSCWGGMGKRTAESSSDWLLNRLLMAQKSTPLDERSLFGPENIVRGQPIQPPANLVRMSDQVNPWTNNDMVLAQPQNNADGQNDFLSKLRIYQLLNG